MKTRLPVNVEQLQSLSELAPSVILGARKPKLNELSFLPLFNGDLPSLQQQWDRLSVVRWNDADDAHVEEFWIQVLKYTDAANEAIFADVAKFALSMLCRPLSNASVERMFSQMALIKTKLRNRMKQPLLESIMHIRAYMSRNEICCHKFKPSPDMYRRFDGRIYVNMQGDAIPEDF